MTAFLVRNVITQIFSCINVQLFNRYWLCDSGSLYIVFSLLVSGSFVLLSNMFFNVYCSLLLRRECCSFSNGEYLKAGLAQLENWLYDATEEVAFGRVSSFVYISCLLRMLTGKLKPGFPVRWFILGGTETYSPGCRLSGK